jgi:hypothetical protein
MYKELFTLVSDRLEKEVPQLHWIDAEMGQLSSRGGTRPPVAFPCALVEISYTSCDTLSGGKQRITAEIQLRIGFNIPGPTNSNVPDKYRDMALSYMDVLDRVHQAMQWWDGGRMFNPMRRIRAIPEKGSAGFKTWLITYSTSFLE